MSLFVDPRLLSLSESNQAPNATEEASYRRIVEQYSREVADLDSRIEEMNLLISLQKQQFQKLNEYKAVLNPVRRLVHDVLYEIFLWYNDCSGQRGAGGLWLLSQVCRSWRVTVFSFPILWSSIDVSFDTVPRTSGPVILLLRQLKYAEKCLLDVSLRASSFTSNSHPLLPIILSTTLQWRSLSLNIPISSYNQLRPFMSFLASLSSLEMRPVDVRDCFSQIPDIFSFASNLRSVSSLGFSKWHHSVQLQNIVEYNATELQTKVWTIPEHVNILCRMPNLERCHLDCHFVFSFEFPPSVGSCKLLRLQYLSVHCHDEGVLPRLLLNLTLPALKTLRLSGSVAPSTEPIQKFLERSNCSIDHLILMIVIKNEESTLLALLRLFPHVETLDIRHNPTSSLTLLKSDLFLAELACSSPSKPCLLPKLKSLDLECVINATLLIRAIESRWDVSETVRCHSRLTGVNIFSRMQENTLFLSKPFAIERLRAKGFNFGEFYQKNTNFGVSNRFFQWPRAGLAL